MLLPARTFAISLALAAAGCSSTSATASGGGGGTDAGTAGSLNDGGTTGDASPSTGGPSTANAPLDAALQGTATTANGSHFNTPKGWTSTSDATGAALTAPTSAGACTIAILAPRPAAADQAGREAQLLEALNTQYPGHLIADAYGNAPPAHNASWHGTSGTGFEFVGFDLEIDHDAIQAKPYLAVFGTTAVPVIPYAQTANGACLLSNDGEVNALEVFHTLTIDGFTPSLPMAPSVVGDWFAGSTGIGIDENLKADGQYIDASVYEIGGTKTTTSESGSYALARNVLSFAPTQPAGAGVSHYVRTYEQYNTTAPNGTVSYLCELKLATGTPPSPYEICYWRE